MTTGGNGLAAPNLTDGFPDPASPLPAACRNTHLALAISTAVPKTRVRSNKTRSTWLAVKRRYFQTDRPTAARRDIAAVQIGQANVGFETGRLEEPKTLKQVRNGLTLLDHEPLESLGLRLRG